MKWECDNDYLDQFSPAYKGTIGDRFCRAVRAGCDDPQAVLEWLENDLRHNDSPEWQKVFKTCEAKHLNAWEFAEHILERESLSFEDKLALKKGGMPDYAKSAMANDAPTAKQLKYLQGLGCKIVPANKLEASELINSFVNSREPKKDYKETPF